jgi:hypothetical protein
MVRRERSVVPPYSVRQDPGRSARRDSRSSNLALGDRDADEHRRHGLRHRLRHEAVPVGAAVLVVLEQDGIALGDEEPGDRVAVDIVGKRPRRAVVAVGELEIRVGAAQLRHRPAAGHLPGAQELVVVAERADHEAQREPPRRRSPDRIALGRAVSLGIRPVASEGRAGGGRRDAGGEREDAEQGEELHRGKATLAPLNAQTVERFFRAPNQ